MNERPRQSDSRRGLARAALIGVSVLVWPVVAIALAGACLSGMALATAVTLICAAALVVLGVVAVRMGRARRQEADAQGGSVMVEFIMVLPILLGLVLVMGQSSLLMIGNLCVNYAAYAATRSAVVVIPQYRADEPHNTVAWGDTDKTERIRAAAVWAMVPVSCGSRDLDEADTTDLSAALERLMAIDGNAVPAWVNGRLGRKLRYANRYTTISLSDPAAGDTYGEDEDVQVTVYHTFYLGVPYAGWLFTQLDPDNAENLDFGNGRLGLVIRATQRLTNEGEPDFIEPDTFE